MVPIKKKLCGNTIKIIQNKLGIPKRKTKAMSRIRGRRSEKEALSHEDALFSHVSLKSEKYFPSSKESAATLTRSAAHTFSTSSFAKLKGKKPRNLKAFKGGKAPSSSTYFETRDLKGAIVKEGSVAYCQVHEATLNRLVSI